MWVSNPPLFRFVIQAGLERIGGNMARKSKWNTQTIQEFLNSTGSECILLTKDFENLKNNFKFQCKCGNIFERKFHNMVSQKSYFCNDCSKKNISDTYKLSHKDYLERLHKKNICNIIPLESYQTAKTKILHQCVDCGYKWRVTPSNILSLYGCPSCNGGHCVIGKSDMWTTSPEIARLLKNKEDGYTHSQYSNKVLEFVCPECNNIVKTRPASVAKRGFTCRICSDGISRPNKFMEQLLQHLDIEYIAEKTFDWSDNKRYDFYIPEHRAIIEVMGMQHYKETGFCGTPRRTLREEKDNDVFKKNLAETNGITHYFMLDFSHSNLEYMKNSFVNSDMVKIFHIDTNNIDFDSCYRKTFTSKMIQAIDLWNNGVSTPHISKILKVAIGTVIKYLHDGNDIGLCKYNGLHKEVICITTGEVFSSVKSATETYHCKQGQIGACCRGERKFIETEEGLKLQWRFYKEYLDSVVS